MGTVDSVPCLQVTYTSLIDACAKASDLQQALKVFSAMEKAGVRADEVCQPVRVYVCVCVCVCASVCVRVR